MMLRILLVFTCLLSARLSDGVALAIDGYTAEVIADSTAMNDSGTTMATIPRGQRVFVFETNGKWGLIKDPDSERRGWVSLKKVRKVGQGPVVNPFRKAFAEAVGLINRQRWSAAVDQAETAVRLAVEVLGEEHLEVIHARDRLATALSGRDRSGDKKRATVESDKARQSAEKLLGLHHPSLATVLNNLSLHQSSLDDLAAALETQRRSTLAYERSGADTVGAAAAFGNLGFLHKKMGNLDLAIEAYDRALKIDDGRLLSGDFRRGIRANRERIGRQLADGDGWQSVDLPKKVREIADLGSADLFADFQLLIRGTGKQSPLPSVSEANDYLEGLTKRVPANLIRLSRSEQMTAASNLLQRSANKTGDHSQAIRQHEQSLALNRLIGLPDASLGYIMISLADKQATADQLSDAGETLRMAATLILKSRRNDVVLNGALLNTQGRISDLHGDHPHAIRCYQRSIAFNYLAARQWERIDALPDPVRFSRSQMDLFGEERHPIILETYWDLNRSRRYKKNLYLPAVAGDIAQLAAKLSLMGQFAQAISTINDGRTLLAESLNPMDGAMAKLYASEAAVYRQIGEYELARLPLQKAVEIQETVPNLLRSQSMAVTYDIMADVSASAEQWEEALTFHQKSYEIVHELFGMKHSRTLLIQASIARSLHNMGRHQDAADRLEAVLRSADAGELSVNAPDLLAMHCLMGEIQAALGEVDRAVDSFRRSIRMLRRYCIDVLPTLPESKQLAFLQFNPVHYQVLALRALYPHHRQTAVADAMAEIIINTRNMTLETITGRPASEGPEVERIGKLRAKVAAAVALEAPESEVDSLMKQLDQIQSHAGRKLPPSLFREWLPLESVRASLHGALLVIKRIDWMTEDAPKQGGAARYAAFVVQTDKPTQMVDLGGSNQIEDSIKRCRRRLQPTTVGELTEKLELEETSEQLQGLYISIAAPLIAVTAPASRWWISADAELHGIPLGCLRSPEGRYLIETHEIVYAIGFGKDELNMGNVAKSNHGDGTGSLLVVANPDFDRQKNSLTRPTVRDTEVKVADTQLEDNTAAVSRGGLPRSWSSLPGTATEVQAGKNSMARFLERDPDDIDASIFLGSDASENVVRQAESPVAMLLATHGFFLTVPERYGLGLVLRGGARGLTVTSLVAGGAAERDGRIEVGDVVEAVQMEDTSWNELQQTPVRLAKGLTNDRPETVTVRVRRAQRGQTEIIELTRRPIFNGPGLAGFSSALQNPLLRCGMVFAGVNRADAETDPLDDGYLSGLEIAGLDLRRTDLVILSACETGLGDPMALEGAVGMRHAFHAAGADTVMATAWNIPDQQTGRLMGEFWERMADTRDPAAAIAAAKRKLIQSNGSDNDASHPTMWGAFTVTERFPLQPSDTIELQPTTDEDRKPSVPAIDAASAKP